jgi:hypothetical protein
VAAIQATAEAFLQVVAHHPATDGITVAAEALQAWTPKNAGALQQKAAVHLTAMAGATIPVMAEAHQIVAVPADHLPAVEAATGFPKENIPVIPKDGLQTAQEAAEAHRAGTHLPVVGEATGFPKERIPVIRKDALQTAQEVAEATVLP